MQIFAGRLLNIVKNCQTVAVISKLFTTFAV